MASKQGVSAQTLQRATGLGSYQTAWTMLRKFRTVMEPSAHSLAHRGFGSRRDLHQRVQIVPQGRGASGKTLVAGAAECRGQGVGRARLQIIPNAAAPALAAFLRSNLVLGSLAISDGWTAYNPACRAVTLMYTAYKVTPSGRPAHVFLPRVHRLFSLVKRVLDSTYQGSVQPEHLQAYLDEFAFRSNRRHVNKRGLLFYRLLEAAMAGTPAPYDTIASIHRKPKSPPMPPPAPNGRLHTLPGSPAN